MMNNSKPLNQSVIPNEVFMLDDIKIRRDSKGRYCLNDLHKAAVAAGHNYKTCQTEHFLRNNSTQELIHEIQKNGELDFSPCETKAGRYGGTFVVIELVYSYAMWISPEFKIKVIRSFHELQTNGIAVAVTCSP
ncbi:KilA-N domain-containing protein [Vibrio fluvialis]|uniref:KilA-N domain-containing protein n=1 Tax=Vibrio fluvialis TaxID=676 RepID=UPI001EEA3827|nr:KilA-N domain-containing protein [Vibrio fluvialis]MCG6341243.1 KilA-N domain-containing protein [Vibrio fluvialis]